ncbi:MAG: RAD55 family ATPase [Candidatus Anstonellaceae archaeon]
MIFSKIPSGITGLDKIIGGGFIRGSITTISGSTGSGRTTFGIQFLIHGAQEEDEVGMHISFDQPKYSIFGNMSSFDWNLPELEKNKKLIFIEYPHSELKSFWEKENAILELIDGLNVERLVIDPIGPLITANSDVEKKIFLQKLINIIRKWGTTTLIIEDEQFSPDPTLPKTESGIENFSDGFIHLGWKSMDNKKIRMIEVVKMRGSAHEHNSYQYIIDSQGVKIQKELKK